MYDESSGALTELTFDPSELGAAATGISNSGIITGYEYSAPPPGFDIYAGFWTVTGGATLLTDQNGQPAPNTFAVAVNDGGDIVGYHEGTGERDALLWSGDNHSMVHLPQPACSQCGEIITSVSDINDSGTIVGDGDVNMSGSPTGVAGVALEWQDGTVKSLGTLDGSYDSVASWINNEGDVVGSSQIGPDRSDPAHAFLYHSGVMTDLGTLPGDTRSGANSINDGGEIVGSSDGSDSHAFLYVNGTMYDLSSLVDATDPLAAVVHLQDAMSINSKGWIAVNGTDPRDNEQRAFLLIPSN